MNQKNEINSQENVISEEKLQINRETLKSATACIKQAIMPQDASFRRVIYKFNKNYNDDLTSYSGDRTYREVLTFKLPNDHSIHEIRSIEFIDSTETKTSWGDRAYYGKNIQTLIGGKKFTEIASNNSMCYYGDLAAYSDNYYEVLNVKDSDGGAVFISKQFVILNWFFLDDDYYFQIAYSQYVKSWASNVGGGMWINFGTGLVVNLYD